MKAIIQRAKNSKISCDGSPFSEIQKGLVVFIGFCKEDTNEHMDKMINKIIGLRIFEDENQKLNLNVSQIGGEIMVVPNFTIYASTAHGYRPSFDDCCKQEIAKGLYEEFTQKLTQSFDGKVVCGVFRSDMQVLVHNDGPINIIMEY